MYIIMYSSRLVSWMLYASVDSQTSIDVCLPFGSHIIFAIYRRVLRVAVYVGAVTYTYMVTVE
jgi:hypothetical protein